jgi:NhaP-type Na+/H+ or K+/H+ antiporter/mannitol/fructose-specific phosphotransferase system IIA component (Ntr-type)
MGQHDAHLMLLTLAAAIAGGVFLMVLSHRLHVSAISLLLVGGVALGPEGLGLVQPASLGDTLGTIVKLAVALILFEGGLSLDLKGYNSASGVIKRLLTLGVIVTWLLTALAVHLVFNGLLDQGFRPAFCLLVGSLVIVTGPTVISPILKRIRVEKRVHGVLHWEGVLIDPVGVFVAVLCFEWFATDDGGEALLNFLTRFVAGGALGLLGGFLVTQILRRRMVPTEMVNITAIACAMLVFGLAEWVLEETGLLAVTVAGFVLGVTEQQQLRGLREFKAEITELMIGLLFVLLAARLELRQFAEFGAYGALLVAIVALVVRPAVVWICSAGQGLRWQEKAFLSWVAPRGIVAASLASLVGLTLAEHGDAVGGEFAETFVYSVIATTVLLQGSTAGMVARALGLRRPEPNGWMIVGAHALSRRIARFLMSRGEVPVLLIDANARRVALARDRGVPAIRADALDTDLIEEHDDFLGIGNVLALTDNEELNLVVCQRWREILGEGHVHRWTSRVSTTARPSDDEVVFADLPKPSVMEIELERGDARTFHATGPLESQGALTTLFATDGARVQITPAADAHSDGSDVLYLRRAGNYLTRTLRRDLLLRIDETDVDALLDRLLDAVEEALPDAPLERLRARLHDREMVLSSLLGHGVAVPHVHGSGLESRICVIAVVPDGVDLGAPDGEPIRLVFLLVSPEEDPEGHLATLAEIARVVATEESRERLTSAATPEELVTRLREIDAASLPANP